MMQEFEQAVRNLVAVEVAKAEERIRARLDLAPQRDLSFTEALEYLNMSEYTLRNLCRRKQIPHRTYGAEGSKNPRYWFNTASLDQWKREQEEANYQPNAR